jgi:hypothetical protein
MLNRDRAAGEDGALAWLATTTCWTSTPESQTLSGRGSIMTGEPGTFEADEPVGRGSLLGGGQDTLAGLG